jgi:hypothetical protein
LSTSVLKGVQKYFRKNLPCLAFDSIGKCKTYSRAVRDRSHVHDSGGSGADVDGRYGYRRGAGGLAGARARDAGDDRDGFAGVSGLLLRGR